jgi:hypothetical protein
MSGYKTRRKKKENSLIAQTMLDASFGPVIVVAAYQMPLRKSNKT